MKDLILFQQSNEPGKGDFKFLAAIPAGSATLKFIGGAPHLVPDASGFSAFNLLPAATTLAAGKDPVTVTLGTGTEVIARSAGGGVNIKTQASTPADDDNAFLVGVAAANTFGSISATVPLRFQTTVRLNQITEIVFAAGLDQNITNPIPPSTSGDGAAFMFDPTNEQATGITTYATNIILTQKVAGADTYLDSGVAMALSVDFALKIVWGADLKPRYYINDVLVGTGVANTAAASIGVNIGVTIAAGSPAGQKDIDIRFIQLDAGI